MTTIRVLMTAHILRSITLFRFNFTNTCTHLGMCYSCPILFHQYMEIVYVALVLKCVVLGHQ